jgi:hypothetical protein
MRPWLPALLSLIAWAAPSAAGWLSIKNDTTVPLVIQDAPTMPGQKRLKTIRLMPGEVYREFRLTAGEKEVQVFDARCPAKPLFCEKLKWKAADTALQIEPEGKTLKLCEVVRTPPLIRLSAKP